MSHVTMTLQKTKETKNTVRYDHLGDRGVVAVPAVYVLKDHVPSPHPNEIKLTVDFMDG